MAEAGGLGDLLEVVVRGEVFHEWESVSITRPLSAVAGGFKVTAAASLSAPWPLRPGDPVVVRARGANLGGFDVLVTGHVDGIDAQSDSGDRRITATGRDATADLVDCSAMNDPGEFRDITLAQLVEQLAAPFSIEVANKAPKGTTFDLFKVQPGESAWSAIERAARTQAVIAYTTGDGKITLARPGAFLAPAALVEGRNVVTSRLRYNNADRFKVYTVRGQRAGSDDGWGAVVAAIEATAGDEEITRFRPLLVLAEGQVTVESATTRAQWEATFRAARAARLVIDVVGWRANTRSAVWQVNSLVDCKVPSLQVDSRLLIDEVKLKRDGSSGTTAQLTCIRRDAYSPKPVIPKDTNAFDEILGGEEVGDFGD